MYKLVVVEDERDVRKRLVGLIERADAGFEIVSEYENGIDAYDGIIFDAPDLVLTDIKIPYISGIELARRLREVLPLVKIAIITGYNEFDYAKEAANLGVVGFISKPITFEDIAATLIKARAMLDEEYLTASNLNRFQEVYERSLPILRENDLYRLSNTSELTAALENKLRYNGVNLEYKYFIACLFDFDEPQEGNTEKFDLAFSSVRKYVGEELVGHWDFELFSRYEKLCLMIKSDKKPDTKEIDVILERIILRISRFSGMPLSVGMSSVYENNRNFAAMVREAKRSLEYRRILGGGKVFFYENASSPASKLTVDDASIKEIGYAMHFGGAGKCVAMIDELRVALEASQESHHYVVTSILNVLLKACDNLDGLYVRHGGQEGLYTRFFEIKTGDEVFDFLKELSGEIEALNEDVIVSNVEQNLRKITAYMEVHFCDSDISFESVARAVNFSTSYISALLKKNLNTSFVKLLTGMRMEKAKELLADPSLKIIDIAERLGYNDSYYFSHCFKKYMEVSPKEYRNNESKN